MSTSSTATPAASPAKPPSTLQPDRLDRIRALAATLRDTYGLRGRWRWHGNYNTQEVALATNGNGGRTVMDFTRWGMQNGQPRFPQIPDSGGEYPWMHLTKELPLVWDVCADATGPNDPRLYRYQFHGIATPVAEYLAAVDAETVLAMLDRITELEAALADALTAAEDHGAQYCDQDQGGGGCAADVALARWIHLGQAPSEHP